MRTLGEALDEAARSGEGYTFVKNGLETRRSYAELQQTAFRVAGALREAGLKTGDLVALAIDDPEHFLTAFFGATAAGLIPASVAPPGITGERARYYALTARTLRCTGARAVISGTSFVEGFDAVRSTCPDLQFVLSRDDLDAPPLQEGFRQSLDEIAFVQFTSGSTSAPKGVALSHRNLCANIEAINGPSGLGTTAADSAVSWLPLNHDMGLIGMALGPLYSSRPAVLLTPQMFVKRPADWLRAISRHRSTVSFAPNFGYDLVARRIKDHDLEGLDLSCWRVAGCGAEPIHAPTLAAFAERLADVGFSAASFRPCYGLAEHVLAATLPPPLARPQPPRLEYLASAPLVSCGRALAGHRIRIIKDDGSEAREREVGEITLAGPSVMMGYYRDEESTAETVRGGWLHTGDLGYLSDGELFVCGRAREIIMANGRKYHPQDLEWAVDDLAGVRRGRVVAFGVPLSGSNDRVVIVVEAGGDANDALAGEIRRRISDTFGLYVDDIVPVPSGTVGRTTSGKVQRAALKARYQSSALSGTIPIASTSSDGSGP